MTDDRTEAGKPAPAAEPLALRLDDGLGVAEGVGVWEPMHTAPRDGTAVLVLLEGSDIPHAVRWLAATDERSVGSEGWHMTWDGHKLGAIDGPRYWMWCPDDPDA